MQNIVRSFDESAKGHHEPSDLALEQIEALEPARRTLEQYLSTTGIKARVFILNRDHSYPVLLMTPAQESKLDLLKETLVKTDINYSKFPAVRISDLLGVIEKQDSQPFGIALLASREIVNCMTQSLMGLVTAKNQAMALAR